MLTNLVYEFGVPIETDHIVLDDACKSSERALMRENRERMEKMKHGLPFKDGELRVQYYTKINKKYLAVIIVSYTKRAKW